MTAFLGTEIKSTETAEDGLVVLGSEFNNRFIRKSGNSCDGVMESSHRNANYFRTLTVKNV